MTFAPWTSWALRCAVLSAAPAFGQAAPERVATHNDWSVFLAGDPQECYIVAQPTGSSARRDGQPVEVSRGDVRLFVRFNPSENVANEVSFAGGYTFDDATAVRVQIGEASFDLDPGPGEAGGWAWPLPEDDARIVAAMRSGSTASITGLSTRGTTTIDTFSLSGFTAAVSEAESRCP